MDLNCHEYHTYDPKIVGWETPIEDMYCGGCVFVNYANGHIETCYQESLSASDIKIKSTTTTTKTSRTNVLGTTTSENCWRQSRSRGEGSDK